MTETGLKLMAAVAITGLDAWIAVPSPQSKTVIRIVRSGGLRRFA
jgi:hypothetical protein